MEYFEEEFNEAVSPNGQCFDNTCLSLYILAFLEFQVPIHDLPILSLLQDAFLSIPHFTSIMVDDERGVKRWKPVEVKLEEHIIEPKFIDDGMSNDSYDNHFADYISKILMENFSPTKPLWQVHVIKYPTSNSAGTLLFKFHHAIGDGYSLMSVILSSLQRADNTSLPLSFPSLKSSSKPKNISRFMKNMSQFLSIPFNFMSEFGWSLLKSTLFEDDETPIRSGVEAVEFRRTKLSNIAFSMDHIKEIKSNLGVTINDAITGIIFYGIRLYMQNIDYRSRALNTTALVIANTRKVKGYQRVQDMFKTAKSDWGNQITYYHVSVPKLQDIPISSPLQFVRKAHTSIKRKKSSYAPPLITKLLRMKNKLEGPEALAKCIHGTMRKASLLISNVAGPIEQMAWGSHPIGGFFFTLAGIPQSLVITIMSYMGMLRVTIATEEGFIDEQKLMQYLNNAFEIIRHESIAKENISKWNKFCMCNV
ncbi:wax ester synthase/diacylglycerol acyltransferase 4-like isoform X2 [Vicia villosa]|uniref:wax ester synthase/diacylglycerol acyltransferase 4-like isoform X2 n=1 Tax=Vicia villosa TaxID=3911 RepID=UPI00273BDD75|nr:wax ester synthase/diacylglycerol acyltransferase 4-like isoform X2 [Vicia villosa]